MKISFKWYLVSGLTIAFLWASTPESYAQEQTGFLAVSGMVRVNGQPAATGDVVSSGSTVDTAKGSSAVVSLGKRGRVEALPATQMSMSFDQASISIVLDKGSVRVSAGPGVSVTVTATVTKGRE